jgi:hypothetical protein
VIAFLRLISYFRRGGASYSRAIARAWDVMRRDPFKTR